MAFYLGIDNGQKGFFAFYNSETRKLNLATMPTRKGKQSPRLLHLQKDETEWDYDISAIRDLLKTCRKQAGKKRLVAVTEEPRMKGRVGNAKAIVSLARGLGIFESCCQEKKIDLFQVHPSSWKSHFKIIGRPKEASIEIANEIWPKGHFPTPDAADAALLAYYVSEKKP